MEKNALLRKIPNMNELLDAEEIRKYTEILGKDITKKIIQEKLDEVRNSILSGETENEIPEELLKKELLVQLERAARPDMKKVINATGTILHTNLGRAPLARKHMQQLTEILSGYSNLEYDLEKGCRGERYTHFNDLLCRLTGAEAAMAVNNNAAAVLLMLSALGKGKEAIVSRGELVEIGGKFRIPDVMEQSGTMLREVGTTNKTHLEDYESAITEETGMILKVHTSNYQIVGFTESVELKELAALGKKRGIPVMADLGSGVFLPLEKYGLPHEPTVRETVQAGAALVCFSGDKLLGGPQAGIIVGKKKYLDILKRHPLTRALRIDKFTAAALELTLREYLNEGDAIQNIPVLRMISRTSQEISEEAEILCEMIRDAGLPFEVKTEFCESQIGGGAFPTAHLSGKAVVLGGWHGSCQEIADAMEKLPVPIICRCTKNQIVLDVRTIDRKDYQIIVEGLKMVQSVQQMERL